MNRWVKRGSHDGAPCGRRSVVTVTTSRTGPTTASSPPSRVDDAAQEQQHRQPPQRHSAGPTAFGDPLEPLARACPIPHILRYSLDATVDNWTPPSMAESQLAELQNMRRRRKHQRVRARGHGVPAQVSTNGPLVLCGCERRSASIPGGRTGRRVSAYPRSSTGGRET